jgi:hypothetical protein
MGTNLRHIQPSVDFAKVIDRHYVRARRARQRPWPPGGTVPERPDHPRSSRGTSFSATIRSCHTLATLRPCRRGPATRRGGNARTACPPPPAHHTQPAASPTGKPATALTTSGLCVRENQLNLFVEHVNRTRRLGCSHPQATAELAQRVFRLGRQDCRGRHRLGSEAGLSVAGPPGTARIDALLDERSAAAIGFDQTRTPRYCGQ